MGEKSGINVTRLTQKKEKCFKFELKSGVCVCGVGGGGGGSSSPTDGNNVFSIQLLPCDIFQSSAVMWG